jgi:ketosteroid isomerase-like protein
MTVVATTLLVGLTGACATSGRSRTMNADSPAAGVDQTADGTTFNPYHAVVRSKILKAFRGLTNHDAAPALAIMAEDVEYTFEGDHALGGTRVTRQGVERWFGRLFRLLPGPFVIRSVEVSGWPWSTRVVTSFEHQVSPPEGPGYWGAAVQTIEVRWGTAVRIRTRVLDMDRLVKTLDALAATGTREAKAAPILE